MKIIHVVPDGACLFRSLAVSLVYELTGRRVGGGTEWGLENTFADVIHNIVARWIRTLVAMSLRNNRPIVNIRTELKDNRDLYKTIRELTEMIGTYKLNKAFPSSRLKRSIMRQYLPSIQLKRIQEGEWSYEENGPTAKDISMSGRLEHESYASYCRRIFHWVEWGGESECYIAAHILGADIHIYENRVRVRTYSCEKNMLGKSLHIHFSPEECHYDGIINV